MPTYDYECQKCGHLFEVFQSMTDERLKTCPECKGKVKRLLGTGAGIIFKGSGFYETDYRSDGYKTAAKKDADASTSSSSTPSTSDSPSDRKPKSDAKPKKKASGDL